MKKVIYYIFLPLLIFTLVCLLVYFVFRINNYEKLFSVSLDIISGLGILIGGLWTYNKFGWEKRCEKIITLKAALMKYRQVHNWAAAEYRKNEDIARYKISLLEAYRKLVEQLHLSCYLPPKIRKETLEAVWLTVGNDHGKEFEELFYNWDKFEKKIDGLFKKFDKLIEI